MESLVEYFKQVGEMAKQDVLAYQASPAFKEARQKALKMQEVLFGTAWTLLEVCMNLRMGVNGAADEWEPYHIADTVKMLEARLETWQNSIYEKGEKFDAAVRQLVFATIEEVKSYDWWQKDKSSA